MVPIKFDNNKGKSETCLFTMAIINTKIFHIKKDGGVCCLLINTFKINWVCLV